MGDDESEGVEWETVESDDDVDAPFDPSRVRISHRHLSLDVVLARIEDDAIDLEPEFQRRRVWQLHEQSQLIESLLIRIPLPAFYFDATDDDRWLVIDGLQRLSTLQDFVLEQTLVLDGLEFLREYEGSRFDDLPARLRRRIRETTITAFLVDEGTPSEMKFNIFKRINTGGQPLSAQEIRHAMCRAPDGRPIASTYLRQLADSAVFQTATDGQVSPTRRLDEECVLRALAFLRNDFHDYDSHDLDEFLRTRMLELNELLPEERDRLTREFAAGATAAHEIFGRQAFRKSLASPLARRSPVNRALFETWVSTLGALEDGDRRLLVDRRDEVVEALAHLLVDQRFDAAISLGTGAPSKVRYRFEQVEQVVGQVLGA